jgi:uncharacterized protein with HEPN domain
MADVDRLQHILALIDDEIVWNTVVSDLPALRPQLESALARESLREARGRGSSEHDPTGG